ncbi:MAG: epoxyqueuosine reductase QueH [Clostridiales bacterium]|nr:epoxyqueuosine reductase QueH [Clostridiales bacterium]
MFFTGDIKDKKILLHACCGPCSLGAIEPLLSDGADITVFFYNPCIMDGEFEKRLDALKAVCAHYSLPLVVPEHDYASFLGYAAERAADREGGARCSSCFTDRLIASADYAGLHGFDAYTTTLTVSPHKNSKLIFSIADSYDGGAPFLPRDFKKRDGFLLSTRRSCEFGIYRQRFCGCEYSFAQAQEQINSAGGRA